MDFYANSAVAANLELTGARQLSNLKVKSFGRLVS